MLYADGRAFGDPHVTSQILFIDLPLVAAQPTITIEICSVRTRINRRLSNWVHGVLWIGVTWEDRIGQILSIWTRHLKFWFTIQFEVVNIGSQPQIGHPGSVMTWVFKGKRTLSISEAGLSDIAHFPVTICPVQCRTDSHFGLDCDSELFPVFDALIDCGREIQAKGRLRSKREITGRKLQKHCILIWVRDCSERRSLLSIAPLKIQLIHRRYRQFRIYL